jgi:hypothetical protein
MSVLRPLAIERLRHVPRELLRSRDLNDQLAADAEMMWWHQRAVHDAVGIVAGLVVDSPSGGPVSVTPGLAYDPRGRELILTRSATIDLPEGEVVEPLVLVLRRCCDRAPELAWDVLARLDRCDGVPLARLDPDAPDLPRPWAVRARPTARPRIAFGATLPGATAWEPWPTLLRMRRGLALQVRVATRPAGFTGHPCYFAWLQWPGAASPQARPASLGFAVQHLDEETVDGFTFRVVLLPPFSPEPTPTEVRFAALEDDAVGLAAYARAERLSVAWLGLEGDNDLGGDA